MPDPVARDIPGVSRGVPSGRSAAFGFNFTLVGFEDLLWKLDNLGPIIRDKALASALRTASNKIAFDARRNLEATQSSEAGGELAASVFVIIKRYSRDRVVVGLIGTKWPEGAHGHLYEYGTVERPHPITGTSGIMPARPFLRPAVDANRQSSINIIAKRIKQHIERTWRRHGIEDTA